jgi:hypothetical protein
VAGKAFFFWWAEGNAGLVAPNNGQLLESALRGLLQLLNQITKKGRHDVSPSQEEKIVYIL